MRMLTSKGTLHTDMLRVLQKTREQIDRENREREDARQVREQLNQEIASRSQAAIDALPAGREKRMVIAVDKLLSGNLGNAEAYLGAIGLPATRELQRVLEAYGITPDYAQSTGSGYRTRSRS